MFPNCSQKLTNIIIPILKTSNSDIEKLSDLWKVTKKARKKQLILFP